MNTERLRELMNDAPASYGRMPAWYVHAMMVLEAILEEPEGTKSVSTSVTNPPQSVTSVDDSIVNELSTDPTTGLSEAELCYPDDLLDDLPRKLHQTPLTGLKDTPKNAGEMAETQDSLPGDAIADPGYANQAEGEPWGLAEAVALLREARDTLWHDYLDIQETRHSSECIGCELEDRIDTFLTKHPAKTETIPPTTSSNGKSIDEVVEAMRKGYPALRAHDAEAIRWAVKELAWAECEADADICTDYPRAAATMDLARAITEMED